MFFRTARMLESGMKPVYIFDGKPPAAKREELNRRFEKRGEATEDLENIKEVYPKPQPLHHACFPRAPELDVCQDAS